MFIEILGIIFMPFKWAMDRLFQTFPQIGTSVGAILVAFMIIFIAIKALTNYVAIGFAIDGGEETDDTKTSKKYRKERKRNLKDLKKLRQ